MIILLSRVLTLCCFHFILCCCTRIFLRASPVDELMQLSSSHYVDRSQISILGNVFQMTVRTALLRLSNLRLINLKINEAHNLLGYRVDTPLADGSTGLRWWWLNYLAGIL